MNQSTKTIIEKYFSSHFDLDGGFWTCEIEPRGEDLLESDFEVKYAQALILVKFILVKIIGCLVITRNQ